MSTFRLCVFLVTLQSCQSSSSWLSPWTASEESAWPSPPSRWETKMCTYNTAEHYITQLWCKVFCSWNIRAEKFWLQCHWSVCLPQMRKQLCVVSGSCIYLRSSMQVYLYVTCQLVPTLSSVFYWCHRVQCFVSVQCVSVRAAHDFPPDGNFPPITAWGWPHTL